jgi:CheY-like chemotaxis protein
MVMLNSRILIVDDDVHVLRLLKSALNSFGWNNVLQAANGLEALEIVGGGIPDLVVTDVIMPELDGYGLLRRLRESPETAHVPVLMLAANEGRTGKNPPVEPDDYLSKPFTLFNLKEKVEKLLSIKGPRI